MKERPIPFSAPMVRALLDGSKTQTRRVVKMKPHHLIEQRDDGRDWPWCYDGERDADSWLACPYGQPGDRLWVREAWRVVDVADCFAPREITSASRIWFEADTPHQPGFGRYRPGMFMPRWASRITLEVTGVRVERLQDISEADAMAEGAYTDPACPAYDSFAALWESINGAGSWDANPWVWVVKFKRLQP